jgi:signal peptidase I
MKDPVPPPILSRSNEGLGPVTKCLLALAAVPGVFVLTLLFLRIIGLIHPYYIPTGSMSPAVAAGDHVFTESITFTRRKPSRGDIVAFSTLGIRSLPQDTVYLKRVAGVPGEHIRISGGELYVDGIPVPMKNAFGQIAYEFPEQWSNLASNVELTVQPDEYYLLGDNSTNSFDSRSFGCVPRQNIQGRIYFCYWPLRRFGFVQ